jgi:hypothetical protein
MVGARWLLVWNRGKTINIQAAWASFRDRWHTGQPVRDVNAFDAIEEGLGRSLPADYKWFLMESGGGETLRPLPYLRLYTLDELLPRRDDGQPPGVIEIGTDDSDGYALDLTVYHDTARYPVVRYPLGDRDRSALEIAAKDFGAFFVVASSGL